jgi:hypothetical protein
MRKDMGDASYYAALEKQALPFLPRVRNILMTPLSKSCCSETAHADGDRGHVMYGGECACAMYQ